MILYPYQQIFLDKNPRKCLLNWEARCGKSLPASIWIDNPCRSGNTYIICKKQNKQDWLRYNTKATVLTKEAFKKIAHTIINPTGIVTDEVHNFGSPLFVKGRSQMAGSLYELLRKYPNCDVLGLSATMVRNNAWSLHTLLCYIGVYYDWRKWREQFFELRRMPFLRFPAWFPKKNWRQLLKPFVEKHTDIVSLKDVVEYLPPATTRIIRIKQPKYVPPEDEVVTWVQEHLAEQKGKVKEILELGYRKVILVCNYTEQINTLAKELAEHKPVFILDGHTKDADLTKKQAQEAEECFFICQSSCLEGFDGWMFGAMVFVSMSHSSVNFIQAMGRLRHPQHLKTVEIIIIIGGVWDQRIYDSVREGFNFSPHNYL